MKRTILLLSLVFLNLFADKVIVPQVHSEEANPWYTGPLLAPSSAVVPVGHFNFEPYVYIIANTGGYDSHGKVVKADTSWSNSFQPVLEIGLTKWMDVQILPAVAYNYNQHQARWVFQDFILTVDFQLLKQAHIDDWTPYIKFFVTEIFPTGKYRNLNPKKMGVDIGGTGSFRTSTGLVIGEMFHIQGANFVIARLSLEYQLPAPVRLLGLNNYGGGYGTNARFFPGQNFEADLGVELTLNKNWVLACDFVGLWTGKPHFSGTTGKNPDGTRAQLGSPGFSSQYSLAPAIEYNWKENMGVIGGCWFTVAGHNAPRFWSAVFAFNYYI